MNIMNKGCYNCKYNYNYDNKNILKCYKKNISKLKHSKLTKIDDNISNKKINSFCKYYKFRRNNNTTKYNKYLNFINNNDNVASLVSLINILCLGKAEYVIDYIPKLVIKFNNNDILELRYNYINEYIGFYIVGNGLCFILGNSMKRYNVKCGDDKNNWEHLNDNIRYDFINDFLINLLIRIKNNKCITDYEEE